MSLQQATPGPWTHNEGNPTRIIGPDDETVAVLYGGSVGIGRQFENAALMAATPSLYSYITEQAAGGDGNAQKIIESLKDDGDISGPWKYDDFNPRQIIDAEATTIASVFGRMGDDNIQLANARLIGAAPVMRDYVRSRSEAGDSAATELLRSTRPQEVPS